MIALLQRVLSASVVVNGNTMAAIGQGLLVFIGVEKSDTSDEHVRRLVKRVLGYRIFVDENDKMNLSVMDINGAVLFVPQFTLVADTRKGMRPSFSSACPPEKGKQMFQALVEYAQEHSMNIQQGEFGADMKVSLINDGPVTFLLACR